jgi:hypothetical protein
MRRFILTTLMAMTTVVGIAPPSTVIFLPMPQGINPYECLWDAICEVETKGDSLAYNEREIATGIAQIRPILIRDYNERTGSQVSLAEMFSVSNSKIVFMFYAHKYQWFEIETIARKWNGRGEKTTLYWNRVKKQMSKTG